MPEIDAGIGDSLPWFVAQLKPNGFATARFNLQKQGYKTFMPMRETEVRHARKVKTVTRPLFPGYIFVSFDPKFTQWRAINSTYGVTSLIMGRIDAPQCAPSDLMQSLLLRCGEGDNILPPESLEPGDLIRVLNGPFKDVLSKVECLSENSRISVLLDLMGRATRVEFARNDIEIAAA